MNIRIGDTEITLPHRWRIGTDLRPTWQITDHTSLSLQPTGVDTSDPADHQLVWEYRLTQHGSTIFEHDGTRDLIALPGTEEPGRRFTTPAYGPLTADDWTHAATLLLGDLAREIGPGNDGLTDEDWLNTLTPEQLAWTRDHAEELALYAYDRDCGYCGCGHDSAACTVPDNQLPE
ncbi:MAG: hypothetical protein J2P26_00610 [Nocardiopsaceae bacterium]|nr:hypothetical protein [Nocardiopsaceae bacterium]